MTFPQRNHPNVAFVAAHVLAVATGVVGARLVGIYPFGSLAFGDYVDHVSDMDFIAVVDGELSMRERTHLVAELTPDPLVGLPGAGLDLIVVSATEAAQARQQPRSQVAVGLFAGWRWQPDAVYDERDDPGPHLAAAIARQTGASVIGPPPTDVFGPVPRPWLLAACRAELAWWLAQQQPPTWPRSPVLNACRAWRFAEEDVLCSKLAGGEWALAREIGDRGVIEAALRMQRGEAGGPVDRRPVEALLRAAVDRLEAAD